MKKLNHFVILTIVLTLATSSIYGQDPCYQEDDTCSSAYMQSTNTAHWSVYIPIAIIVGAAIWFGVADHDSEKFDSSDSQNALGSIDNSIRNHRSSSSKYSSSSKSSYDRNSYSYSRHRRASDRVRGNHSH
jgi:hypothetical protein